MLPWAAAEGAPGPGGAGGWTRKGRPVSRYVYVVRYSECQNTSWFGAPRQLKRVVYRMVEGARNPAGPGKGDL